LHPDLRSRAALVSLISTLVLAAGGCGYRVAGRGTTLPPGAHTIAVPALVNHTTTYRIEQRFTEALVHEFIARTNYRVVPEADGADLVLQGEVTSLGAGAVLYDPTTGAASTLLVTLQLKIGLRDRSGKTLYQNNALVFREPYQISGSIASFFQEESPALDRMSRDFAARVVSDILDNF
jgi:hypothetical protein